jgi:hypothetical protein
MPKLANESKQLNAGKPWRLSNKICIGERFLGAGQALKVLERTKVVDHLFLSLTPPAALSGAEDFRLQQFVRSEQNCYCILVAPAWICDDEPVTTLSVLRVVNKHTLMTITIDELEQVRSDCRTAVTTQPYATETEVVGVLGYFPGPSIRRK